MHLRLGDFYLEVDKQYLQSPDDKRNFNESKILDVIENNKDKIMYFFCDNVNYRNKIKNKYSFIKTTELSVGHTSLFNTKDIDFFNAVLEFYILLKSEEIYMCSFSGFSIIASLLGSKKNYKLY